MDLISFKNYINRDTNCVLRIEGVDDSVTELTSECEECIAFYGSNTVVYANETCKVKLNGITNIELIEDGPILVFKITTEGRCGAYETMLKVSKKEGH